MLFIKNIIALFGGIAMFLFGMSLMSDSLKKIAGNRTEIVLYKITNKHIKAIGIGAVVTALVQSSSAVSAMAVSLVESKLINLNKAIGILLGAVLGTSATGWIIFLSSVSENSNISNFFSASVISAFFSVIGIVLKLFIKNKNFKRAGDIFLGFAVLMFGIGTMSEAALPLKNSSFINDNILSFANPLLGIAAGIALAAILQSASASVGLIQTFAVSGLISFKIAFPLLLGIGIGASVPVLLSAAGKGNNPKRTALSYLIINLMGAILIGLLFYSLNEIFGFSIFEIKLTSFSVALINTLYRLIIVIINYPLIGVIEKTTKMLIKDKKYIYDLG